MCFLFFFVFVYCWLINRSALFLQFAFLCRLDSCFLVICVVKFKLFWAWLVCNFECFLTWFLFFAFFVTFVCCWLIALLFHWLLACYYCFCTSIAWIIWGWEEVPTFKYKCRFQNANAGSKTQMKISREGAGFQNTNAGFKTQMRQGVCKCVWDHILTLPTHTHTTHSHHPTAHTNAGKSTMRYVSMSQRFSHSNGRSFTLQTTL